MVSVAGGCVAMPCPSGGSAERLGLHVERPRQPLENHRRRSALDLPAFEDADEALRDLGPLCQLMLSQSFRFPERLDDLPDLPRSQGSTPIGQDDVSRQTHLVGWSAHATRSSPRAAGRGRSQRKELRGRRGGSRLSGSDRERGDGAVVRRKNRRDHDEDRAELDPGDLTDETRTRGDQADDVVEVSVVVHTPDPGRIRRAGLGDRRENTDDPREQQGQECRAQTPRTHGPNTYPREGLKSILSACVHAPLTLPSPPMGERDVKEGVSFTELGSGLLSASLAPGGGEGRGEGELTRGRAAEKSGLDSAQMTEEEARIRSYLEAQ